MIGVISPHADDAFFSVAESMLSSTETFAIICPFMGIPPIGQLGHDKQVTLNREHYYACRAIGALEINGPMLDDAARPSPASTDALVRWFASVFTNFDFSMVWVPFGIHHPDHLDVALTAVWALDSLPTKLPVWVYEELPYRVLYPNLLPDADKVLMGYNPAHLQRKKELCRMYASQVDEQLERCLYVPERLWEPR